MTRQNSANNNKWTTITFLAVLIGFALVPSMAKADTCGSKTSNTEGWQCLNTTTETDKFVAGTCLPTLCMGQGTDVLCCKPKSLVETATPTGAPTAAGGASSAAPPATNLDNSGCGQKLTGFSFPCPLGERGISRIIGDLIKWALGVVGGLFLVMFVYGGFQYIISGENAKSAEMGQKTLVNAVIGMAIIVGAYILIDSLTKLFKLGLT